MTGVPIVVTPKVDGTKKTDQTGRYNLPAKRQSSVQSRGLPHGLGRFSAYLMRMARSTQHAARAVSPRRMTPQAPSFALHLRSIRLLTTSRNSMHEPEQRRTEGPLAPGDPTDSVNPKFSARQYRWPYEYVGCVGTKPYCCIVTRQRYLGAIPHDGLARAPKFAMLAGHTERMCVVSYPALGDWRGWPSGLGHGSHVIDIPRPEGHPTSGRRWTKRPPNFLSTPVRDLLDSPGHISHSAGVVDPACRECHPGADGRGGSAASAKLVIGTHSPYDLPGDGWLPERWATFARPVASNESICRDLIRCCSRGPASMQQPAVEPVRRRLLDRRGLY